MNLINGNVNRCCMSDPDMGKVGRFSSSGFDDNIVWPSSRQENIMFILAVPLILVGCPFLDANLDLIIILGDH